MFVCCIVYFIYNFFYYQYSQEHLKCNINNYNIDDMIIIKRTPEYEKLIDNLIDEKSFIFNDDEIKVLKNSQQIFNINNSIDDNKKNISNISNDVYLNCAKQLINNTFDFTDIVKNEEHAIKSINENFDNLNDIRVKDIIEEANDYIHDKNDDIIDVSSNEYIDIKNMLKNDIKKLIGPNCFNMGVLKQNMPLINNYLKNYYQDLYGNKVNADLKDYFIAYYTFINNDDDVGLPVETLIGNSNFVIPDQYKNDSHFTNAYNVDWSRIINPISYSQ